LSNTKFISENGEEKNQVQ